MTITILLTLGLLSGLGLAGGGIYSLMFDMFPEMRRHFIQFWTVTGGVSLAGISLIMLLAWATGHLQIPG